MSYAVVTGWPFKLHEIIGRRFLETFTKHWPEEVALIYYVDQFVDWPRGFRRYFGDIPGNRAFVRRHQMNDAAHGRVEHKCWTDSERQRGRSYKTDAARFGKQAMIIKDAALGLADGDVMIWLDPEVKTDRDVPMSVIKKLTAGADLAYLGRIDGYPDTSMLALRLGRQTRALVEGIANLYESDGIFRLPEWHLAAALDHCRLERERHGMTSVNLTPACKQNAWQEGPLKPFADLKRPLGVSHARRSSGFHRV